jgi:glycosyltransferase involved in cell wall biosynthesis
MVRTAVFRQVGGFSGKFGDSIYEDADFCFSIRAAGYSVLYQPDSVVAHHGVGSRCGEGRTGMPALEIQRGIFADKWAAELEKHYPHGNDLIDRAARRLTGERTALVVDSFIPFDDRSAGGMRLLAIMRLMRELNWHVVFVADDGGEYEPYVSRVRRAGVEVIPHRGDATRVIEDIGTQIDLAWVSRPDLLQRYLPPLRRKATAIVYDTVDLHFLRLQREAVVTGRDDGWRAMRELEIALIQRSDCTVVTSPTERDLLIQGGLSTHVIPIIEQPVQTHTAYSERQGLLFLANYTHQPNVDAALWLIDEIMPRVWTHIPNLCVTLAGAEPTPVIQRLAGEYVRVTGHAPDIRPVLEHSRVFVAPLRFGAGMKGKVVKSLVHSLPVITTSCGAEGIGLLDEDSALIADDAASFAEAIVRLYNDEPLWKKLSMQGHRVAEQYTPQAVKPLLESALNAALNHQHKVRIDVGSSAHTA